MLTTLIVVTPTGSRITLSANATLNRKLLGV